MTLDCRDACLVDLDDGVEFAVGVHLGAFVVGVLLPLAVDDESVAVGPVGQVELGLPDAEVPTRSMGVAVGCQLLKSPAIWMVETRG